MSHFSPDDHRYFHERAVDLEFAFECGVRRAGHEELYGDGFRAGRQARLSGIVFPHVNPISGDSTPGVWRPDPSVGAKAKYLRPKDHAGTERNRSVFFTPQCTKENLEKSLKTKPVTIMICESATKAMALQSELDGKRFMCIGLSGVDGGAHRRKEMREKPDGSKELVPVGEPRLNEWLSEINWLDRNVFIVFDNDVNDPKQAEKWKQKVGVIRAEEKLARLLRQRGAFVSLADFPYRGKKMGVDDMLATEEPKRVVDWILRRSITKRDVDLVARGNRGVLAAHSVSEFVQVVADMPPPLVEDYVINEGFLTLFGAPEGFGKSFMALQMSEELGVGSHLINSLEIREPVGSLICNFELSDEQMKRRITSFQYDMARTHVMRLPLGPFTLNRSRFTSTAGRKRLNGEGNLGMICDYMAQHKLKVCFIDNIAKAIDGDESRDAEMAKELLDDLKRAAQSYRIAFVLMHHTKKISREGVYRPQDAIIGVNSWVRFVDNVLVGDQQGGDDSARFKLTYAKLREARRGAVEIHRTQDTRGWTGRFRVEQWKGETAAAKRLEKVMEFFEPGELVTSGALRELLFGEEDAKTASPKVSKLMAEACRKGMARKEGKGEWRIGKPPTAE